MSVWISQSLILKRLDLLVSRSLLISAGAKTACAFSSPQPHWCNNLPSKCSAFNLSQKYWSLVLCSRLVLSGLNQSLGLWSEGQTVIKGRLRYSIGGI